MVRSARTYRQHLALVVAAASFFVLPVAVRAEGTAAPAAAIPVVSQAGQQQDGANNQSDDGAKTQSDDGATAQRDDGAKDQRDDGAQAQRHDGAKDQHDDSSIQAPSH